MKTERRHELEQNSLAAWIEQTVESLRPYSTAIIGGGIALLVLGGAFWYIRTQDASAKQAAWDDYYDALNQRGYDELEDIGLKYPNQPVGVTAALVTADRQLQAGLEALLQDRTAAIQELRQASENYAQVVTHADDDLLLERGLIGKAYALESLGSESAEDLRLAQEAYEEYLDRFPDGIFATVAGQRLADLGRTNTLAFYDWLAAQQPSATGTEPDLPGLSPETDLDTIPEGPDSEGSIFDSSLMEDEATGESVDTETPDPAADTSEPVGDTSPAGEESPAPDATSEPEADGEGEADGPDESPADPGDETSP